jgi:hypothetical protein
MNLERAAPLSGVLFVVLFIASVVVSSPPAATASDQDWIASYTGTGMWIGHLATGVCLVLAALSLMSFLVVLWTRIEALRRPDRLSPVPLVAAGVSAACIAAGGVMMATISGSLLIGGGPVPGADVLRLANDAGFGLVGLAGMVSAALSILCLSVQARAVGLFGTRLLVFSVIVSILLLGALAFLPILALLVWLIVVAVTLIRTPLASAVAVGA